MASDELINFTLRAIPRNTNDVDLAGPFFADLLDRGGFKIAGASIRSPKPKSRGRTNKCGAEIFRDRRGICCLN